MDRRQPRHLAESGQRVALIGSGEPADYVSSDGPFSSHYDQGRITRISDDREYWSELAVRSIDRYQDIASRSGISFHDPCGLAQASSATEAAISHAVARGGAARRVNAEWLRNNTGIAIRDSHPGEIFFEDAPAGVINPRALVAAQTLLAESAGAALVDAPASTIKPTPGGVTIATGSATCPTVTADRVLLATGAYGAGLVAVDLALERRLRTIVLAELGHRPEIPSLIDSYPEHEALDGIYWVPPVPFPDGRVMLKIGGSSVPTLTAETNDDITRWFQGGGSRSEAEALEATVSALLPEAEVHSWDSRPCVVTNTATELPFIGFVEDNVAVAVGASGSGAKSSDEIGRLAASLMTPPGWNDPLLDLAAFTPLYR